METKIQTPIELVYCTYCNLITPAWKGWCIHCKAPLFSKPPKKKVLQIVTDSIGSA